MKGLRIKTFGTIFLLSIFCICFSYSQNDEKKQIEDIFKQTSKVKIYAYLPIYQWDMVDRRSGRALVHNNIVNIPEKYLRNKILLTKKQIKKLKKQLLLSDEEINERATCFIPRHTIVFYNTNNTILGYVNICFSCDTIEFSTNFVYLADRMLFQSELFKQFGITFFEETKEEIDAYNTRITEELLEREKKVEEKNKTKNNHE